MSSRRGSTADDNGSKLRNVSVYEAAGILIAREIKRVRKRLKRAAERGREDPELVHGLRVATRQASAAIQVFARILPTSGRKEILRKLRQIRKAAANARDLDVFIEQHQQSMKANKKLLKRLMKKRQRAQRPIIAVFQKTRGKSHFHRCCKKLIKSLQYSDRHLTCVDTEKQFTDWAQVRMRQIVKKFFDQSQVDANDPIRLHRFRIAAKKFRYGVDVLANAFPPGTFAEVDAKFKKLQDLLGEINDRVVAVGRLKGQRNGKGDVSSEDRKLLSKERKKLQRARKRFSRFWRPQLVAEIRAAFTCTV